MTRSFAAWRGGWTLALRIARRDAWAHRGRSLLVLTMVALPVLAMTCGLTLVQTKSIDEVEAIASRMGSAQAVVGATREGTAVEQDTDGRTTWCAGECPKTTRTVTAADVAAIFHARAVPLRRTSTTVALGTHRRTVDLLELDAADPAVRGMVDLTSGRWAQDATEVVVTDAGVRAGLPTSGPLPVAGRDGARLTPRTVVGVAAGAPGLVPMLVAPPASRPSGFLVDRSAPVTWADVRTANAQGMSVASRAVIENPPAGVRRPPSYDHPPVEATLLVVLGTALFITSALLAGPAFAVIAQRQRQALAMVACNGATAAQLRRTMLAQALVLGVLAGGIALALGVGLAPLVEGAVRHFRPTTVWGPLDIPWGQLAIVAGCAAVSSTAAAILPARGLGRLDVIGTLRGQSAPTPARRVLPLLGLAVAAAGGLVLWWSFDRADRGYGTSTSTSATLVGGSILLVLGALCTIPMMLVGLGHLARTAPVPLRLAARDAARQRGRATPTVAAVMAGAIGMSGLGIGVATMDAAGRLRHVPVAPLGMTAVETQASQSASSVRAGVERVLPGTPAVAILVPSTGEQNDDTVIGLAPGCSPGRFEQDLRDRRPPSCGSIMFGGMAGILAADSLRVADPADLDAVLHLPPGARDALARGEIVSTAPDFTATPVIFARARLASDGSGGLVGAPRPVASVVVRHVDAPGLDAMAGLYGIAVRHGAYASPQTAQRLGATLRLHKAVVAPRDELTDDQRDALAALVSPDASPDDVVHTERGYENPYATVVDALFAIAILVTLVATITATALSIGEAQRDLATLAAVGARDRLRRLLSGAHAWLLALVGTALGLLVGAVPGAIFSAYAVKALHGEVTVTVPWPTFGALLLAVPLLSGIVALLVVRGAPDLTRRTV